MGQNRDYDQLFEFNEESLHQDDCSQKSYDLNTPQKEIEPAPKVWKSLWSKDDASQKSWNFEYNPVIEDFSK